MKRYLFLISSLCLLLAIDLFMMGQSIYSNAHASDTVLIPKYQLQVDNVSPTLMYVGVASGGVLTSAASWQIYQLNFNGSGKLVSQLWADGNGNFDHIWDNRASYTYK